MFTLSESGGRRWFGAAVFVMGILFLTVFLARSSAKPIDPEAVLSVGVFHTCALRADGSVDCWGRNDQGQAMDQDGPYIQVSTGGYHSCGLSLDGSLECWGANDFGQANGDAGPFTQISTGRDHTCGLRPDGSVDCWGHNDYGESEDKSGPFVQISAGDRNVCGLKTDGTVECWGIYDEGNAGPFVQISAGHGHVCGLRQDGAIDCWGDNDRGQAEDPTGTFIQVSLGYAHSCALKLDGSVTCWGYNADGQSSPPGWPSYIQISMAWDTSCGLTASGRVICWGNNNYGQGERQPGPYEPYKINVPATLTIGKATDPAGGSGFGFSLESDGPSLIWGEEGDGLGDLYFPSGVALDNDDDVYVADRSNHRIQKFDRYGNFLFQWGSQGSDIGQFNYPTGVAVDSLGNIYVTDQYNHRIQKFDSGANFLLEWGSEGSGDGQFDRPDRIAIDSDGNLYVTEYLGSRVQKFTSEGVFLLKWGEYGSNEGQFNHTVGVAVDSAGNVYVADIDNHRIQKFTGTGGFLTQWGVYGDGDGQFDRPVSVAVDDVDNVYVVDMNNNRIQKFTSDGIFLMKMGSGGAGPGEFSTPQDIALDGWSNLFVVDTFNHRVQKFVNAAATLNDNESVAFTLDAATYKLNEIAPSGWDLTDIACVGGSPQSNDNGVIAGYDNTCGITVDGDIDCWGSNQSGQSEDQIGPFRQVSAWGGHTCGLRLDGSADCWGNNYNIYGDYTGQANDQAGPFTQIEVGGVHTCGLRLDGSVDCWGDSEFGQSADQAGPYIQIGAGDFHSCGLKPDGNIDCWGGSVGNEGEDRLGSFIQLSSGHYHNCALTPDLNVECWGLDERGYVSTESYQTGPYTQISAGNSYTCGLTPNGGADCWGFNDAGQAEDQPGPFVEVSAGGGHTCGLKPDGTIECWGRNDTGQSEPQTGQYSRYQAPLTTDAIDVSLQPGENLTCTFTNEAETSMIFIPFVIDLSPSCDAMPEGLLGYSQSFFGDPVRLDVQDGYAYLVDWSGSIQVFNINDPCHPLPLGSAQWLDNEFQDVTVEGKYAYVANDADGLAKYDISNPNAPVRVDARKDGYGYTNSIFYDGGQYAFVGQHYSEDTALAIYDLTNFPDDPPIFYSPGLGWAHLWEVFGVEERVYIAATNDGPDIRFQILDISNLPATPVALGTLDLPRDGYGNGYAIAIEGEYAYLSALEDPPFDGGLLVVNISNEALPFVEGVVYIPNAGAMPWKRPGLDVVGDMVYMAGGDGLYGFDVSDPSHPTQTLFYPYPTDFGATVGGDVVIRGDLAIVVARRPEPWTSNDRGGLAIYRLPEYNEQATSIQAKNTGH